MTTETERRDYVELLARYLGGALLVDPDRVLERDRSYAVSTARHLIIYRLSQLGWRQVEIGAVMQRDHATVSHSVALVPRRLRLEPDLLRVYQGMPEPTARVDRGDILAGSD